MPSSHVAGFRLFVNHLHLPWNRYQRQNLADLGGAFLKRRSLPIRRLARALAGPSRALRAPDKLSFASWAIPASMRSPSTPPSAPLSPACYLAWVPFLSFP